MLSNYGCVHDCSDEDCNKCLIHGIMLNDCPWDCPDYEDICGRKGVMSEVVLGENE